MNSLIGKKKQDIFLEKSKIKQSAGKESCNPIPIGTYISSNVSNSKRRIKTHVCRRY